MNHGWDSIITGWIGYVERAARDVLTDDHAANLLAASGIYRQVLIGYRNQEPWAADPSILGRLLARAADHIDATPARCPHDGDDGDRLAWHIQQGGTPEFGKLRAI